MADLRRALLWVAVLSGLTSMSAAQPAPAVVALVGGRIIDGTGAPPMEGRTILIRGARIAEVGADLRIPKDAKIVDVTGKTVLPGLVDFHGHMYARATSAMRSQFEAYPLLFLAGGVTTDRSPGDFDPEGMIALRDRINKGNAAGPRIFTAGPYFDHQPSQVGWIKGVASPEEALQKFNEWRDRLDWVKFYTRITEAEMGVVLEAARRAGLPSAGHLNSVPAARAIEMGITCLEHGIFAMGELVPPGTSEQSRNCALAGLDLDSPAVENLVSSIVKNRVVIDPTIIVFQAQHPGFQPVAPDWSRYLSPEGQAHQARIQSSQKADPEGASCLERALQVQMRFVKRVHDRGGLIVAGTDPVSPRLIPGYALHREIGNLVLAGLTPLEAIKAATLDAAIALRREKDFGSIQPGKLADLVVVGGDPSAGIDALGRIEMVFKEGVEYDPAALRRAAVGQIR
jgi:imidazolonepropionase-like amidohydrolase